MLTFFLIYDIIFINGLLIFTTFYFLFGNAVENFYFRNSTLSKALQNNNNYIAKLLVYLGEDVNNLQKPLNISISNENIEMVKFLIKMGADVNGYLRGYMISQENDIPLLVAIEKNNFEIVKLMVEMLMRFYTQIYIIVLQ